ncbi:hypothetical protein B0H16DRAFT_1889911 [Mycena metata]|uniref:DUF6534 domain-containing protein n=1 Tax=Mycena metata TaxID=1033252 RepID=A0AAD7N347_9AGAR|nr:hypothetical protein B0H16DRAFT_1889911 [Mycena metata]
MPCRIVAAEEALWLASGRLQRRHELLNDGGFHGKLYSKQFPGIVLSGMAERAVLGVRIIIFTSFTNIYDIRRSVLIYSFLGLFCVKATAIAAAMYFFLSDSNEGFTHESNTLIRRAIKLVVGSAVIVSACSFATLACHLAMPHSMSCVVVYMIVSKIYHTCFLSARLPRPGQCNLRPDHGCDADQRLGTGTGTGMRETAL